MLKLSKYFIVFILCFFTQITLYSQKNTSKENVFDSLSYQAMEYIDIDEDSAVYFANSALSFAKDNNYKNGETFANIILATLDFFQGDYINALNKYVKEEKNLEKIKKATYYHCLFYNNLACIYYKSQEYEMSMIYYKKSLLCAKELNDFDYIITSYNNIAGGAVNLKDYQQGKIYYDSLSYFIESNNIKYENLPIIYLNIANYYFFLKDYLIAEKYYNKAEELCNETIYNNCKILVYQKIIYFNVELENYSKAEYYFNMISDSLLNQDKYEFKKEKLLFDAYRIYQAKEDYKSALTYLKECYEIMDSNHLEELDEKVSEYKVKYEVDSITNKTKEQENKLQQQMSLILVLSVFLFVFITLLAFLFYFLKQKNKLNRQLKIINAKLEEKNTEIYNNLNYASEIQKLIIKNIKKDLKIIDYFIIDRAKFKVGGDFYLFKEKDKKLYIVLADCTGHGISGAFLSNLAYFYLLNAIEKNKNLSEILTYINNKFYDDISNNNFLYRDSLCLTILCIENENISYCGSKSKLWYYNFEQKELIEIKTSSNEIGFAPNLNFETKCLKVSKNDIVYLSSDGFPDQFGDAGKMKYHRFRTFLKNAAEDDFEKAKPLLENELNNWQGNHEQTDDILTIGIKIL